MSALIILPQHFSLLFSFSLILFVMMSLVLFYHWFKYRAHNAGVIIAGAIYLTGGGLLITLILTALVRMVNHL